MRNPMIVFAQALEKRKLESNRLRKIRKENRIATVAGTNRAVSGLPMGMKADGVQVADASAIRWVAPLSGVYKNGTVSSIEGGGGGREYRFSAGTSGACSENSNFKVEFPKQRPTGTVVKGNESDLGGEIRSRVHVEPSRIAPVMVTPERIAQKGPEQARKGMNRTGDDRATGTELRERGSWGRETHGTGLVGHGSLRLTKP